MTQEQKPLPGAGRELDLMVAEKMGREVKTIATNSSGQPIYRMSVEHGDWKSWTGVPAYSTRWEAAGEIVEYLKGKNIGLDLHNYDMSNLDEYAAEFFSRDDTEARAYGNTAPHAICRAFLALPDFEVKE